MMVDLKEKISDIAASIAGEYGVEVVSVEVAGSMRRPLVRVFIDKDGGVTLEDCALFSRAVSALLDVEDPIPSAYTLEVSSPGLDRPLKGLADFQRSVGKLCRVTVKEPVEGRTFYIGRIRDVQGEVITLLTDKEREVQVPFRMISKARLEIEI